MGGFSGLRPLYRIILGENSHHRVGIEVSGKTLHCKVFLFFELGLSLNRKLFDLWEWRRSCGGRWTRVSKGCNFVHSFFCFV